MSRVRVGLILALCAVLAGCGISSGAVDGKAYAAPYTFWTQQCVPIGNNACGSFILIPNYVPECWRLDLRDGDDTGSVCVDRANWESIRAGQHWPRSST